MKPLRTANTCDAAILNRLIQPKRSHLSKSAARAFLKIRFSEDDRIRMHELITKAQDDSLTSEEKVEIESYERVGHLLDLMHSQARIALKS